MQLDPDDGDGDDDACLSARLSCARVPLDPFFDYNSTLKPGVTFATAASGAGSHRPPSTVSPFPSSRQRSSSLSLSRQASTLSPRITINQLRAKSREGTVAVAAVRTEGTRRSSSRCPSESSRVALSVTDLPEVSYRKDGYLTLLLQ
jgi:hypothetical protein